MRVFFCPEVFQEILVLCALLPTYRTKGTGVELFSRTLGRIFHSGMLPALMRCPGLVILDVGSLARTLWALVSIGSACIPFLAGVFSPFSHGRGVDPKDFLLAQQIILFYGQTPFLFLQAALRNVLITALKSFLAYHFVVYDVDWKRVFFRGVMVRVFPGRRPSAS